MPWGDWQFWLVTLVAMIGLVALVRTVVPRRRRGKRTALTISAKPTDRP